ncbi:MAG: DMT family transporter [Hyphomicrobiaceae bacterium]|nr:DMT family transporter [Hyphomicrobiaceae bacterium]
MQKATPGALRPIDGWAALLIVACCACWGFNQVAVKIANAGIPPLYQAGLRSVCSALLLWGWALYRGVPLFGRDGSLVAGIAVGLAFAVDFLLLYPGLALTTASRGVLFLYSMPFFVAIGAHLLVPGDRLTGPKWVGLLAAFGGLAIALGDGLVGTAGDGDLIGDLMCIGAAVSWAASIIIIRTTVLRSISAEKVLFYQLAVSAPLLIGASMMAGEGPASFADPGVVLAFAYTVVPVAFVSYAAWFWLLSRHSPSAMSVFTFLTPVFGAIAGAAILGEALTSRLVAALALVALGIFLVNRPGGARPSRA